MLPAPGDLSTCPFWAGGSAGDPWLASYSAGWYNVSGCAMYIHNLRGKIGKIPPSSTN